MDKRRCERRGVALLVADAAVLWSTRSAPARAAAVLSRPDAALARLGADRVAVAGARAVLFVLAAWVGVGLVAALGSSLPGAAGRLSRLVAAVAVPAVVRRLLVGVLGVGLLAGPVDAALAAPAGGSGHPVAVSAFRAPVSATAPAPTWPTAPTAPAAPGSSSGDPGGSSPPVPFPASPPPHRPAAHPPAPHPSAPHPSTPHEPASPQPVRSRDTTRVRAGDSLWLIAARRLGTDATPARVADYWPRLYTANRAAIGTDPSLIRPGQLLRLPEPRSHQSSQPGSNPGSER